MNKDNLKQQASHAFRETAYNPLDNSQIIIKADDVKEACKNLDEAVSQIAFFILIPLLNYEPQDHFSHCNWLSNLILSSSMALYQMSNGSNFYTINFAWKLPKNETVNDYESSHVTAILTVIQQLPAFHSQQMHKDFIDKYRNSTTDSPSVLCFLYQDQTGDCGAPETAKQSQK